jgi:hypothetical protein
MCVPTVFALMKRSFAIRGWLFPAPSSWRIWISRAVSVPSATGIEVRFDTSRCARTSNSSGSNGFVM